MGKKGFFATLFLVLILIFFIFPISTGKEYFLVPEKIVNLENINHDNLNSDEGNVSFAFDDYFGYVSNELDITYLDRKEYKVSISDNSFINYPKTPQILDIQYKDGSGRSIIETTGYPVIQNDKIAVLTDSSISLYDLDGNLYWKKEILSIVTSLSISGDYVLIGYLDGLCELISISGINVLTYRPGGSRIEAIYSVAISSDGQYITVISGLDPQRFILLQDRKGEFKPIYHIELEKEFRRSIDMYFSNDNSIVFFENPEGVSIFDTELKTIETAGGSGRLKQIYKDIDLELYSLLLADNSGGNLNIVTTENKSILRKQFQGDSLFFKKRDNRYYIGSDNLLMYLKLVSR